MPSIPNGTDPEPKITRKGPAQPEPRSIEKYVNQGKTAPQPPGPRSIADKIEKEAGRRRNPSR
jgi:hypothetical protein